jgi:glyoxylase-like metal-dependent hydrolase (beta-lactamase superfamily II)
VADYTGAVAVGGPAQTRELPGVTITKVAVGPMDNNAYFLAAGDEVVLVDAAAEAPTLLRVLGDRRLARVVTTHGHRDHVGALRDVLEATGARAVASPADAPALPVAVDELVDDGDTVLVGDVPLRVISLVGHTPGSLALHLDLDGGHLFTGDSLFPGGPGNTERDPVRFTSLMDDLERKVFGPLPDSTWVYPGHGADTTLGAERPSLPTWRARGW